MKLKIQTGMGILVFVGINTVIAYIVDTKILRHYGYMHALYINAAIWLVVGYAYILLYDHYKDDWLLIEKFKSKAELAQVEKNKIIRALLKISKYGKIPFFFFIIRYDPAIAVIYFRAGHHRYNGLGTCRIICLFFISAVATSLWWTSVLYFGFSVWDDFVVPSVHYVIRLLLATGICHF